MSRLAPARLRSLLTPFLIALALAGSIGVIAYVQSAVKRIEEELPLRVMEEKRGMERVARHFYELLAAIEAAEAHPTEGNVANIRDHLDTVTGDLEELRERYTFDTLIGASALHAVMSPAVDDALANAGLRRARSDLADPARPRRHPRTRDDEQGLRQDDRGRPHRLRDP